MYCWIEASNLDRTAHLCYRHCAPSGKWVYLLLAGMTRRQRPNQTA